jgi:hypothetical protein
MLPLRVSIRQSNVPQKLTYQLLKILTPRRPTRRMQRNNETFLRSHASLWHFRTMCSSTWWSNQKHQIGHLAGLTLSSIELFKKYRPDDLIIRVEMRTKLSQEHCSTRLPRSKVPTTMPPERSIKKI